MLIFVGELSGSLILSSGRDPATEGDTLELTCNLTSTSLPAAYRPNIIYISWYIRYDWSAETIVNGSALDLRGNTISGYVIKNNGRILVISSVHYFDRRIRCYGREDGGNIHDFHSHSVEIRCERSWIHLLI